MLAAIALCLGTTILLKMQLGPRPARADARPRPAVALIILIPLVWLLSVTMTAGVQKIWHADPRIGFLAQARALKEKVPDLERALESVRLTGNAAAITAAETALRSNRAIQFNQRLDAIVAGTFLVLVSIIVVISVREWFLLLTRRKPPVLQETPPVWLPDYAVAESRPTNLSGLMAVGVALVKEVSGESHLERAQQAQLLAAASEETPTVARTREQVYVESTEQRFNGVRRCC
jgi:carbon starvation protein